MQLDFGHATAFSTMVTSFSGKPGMAMRGLSLAGIFSGSSWASRKAWRRVSIEQEHFPRQEVADMQRTDGAGVRFADC